jgi:hypothetical protein
VTDGLANDEAEAIGFARDVLTSAPPLLVKQLDSLTFVSISVGEAADILDPTGETSREATDDLRAVFFVARGRFVLVNRFNATPSPELDTYCIVVPIGDEGTFSGNCDEDVDLTDFGTAHIVPLPLPPFPTPVSLAEDADTQ